ncbi:MAG: hypothetical protein J6D38_07395 [Solobacterium sp.]|nr:hypothetical protein [Solobacterium sp.]
MSMNDDIFGMLTAKTEDLTSDKPAKPEKPAEPEKKEPEKAEEKKPAAEESKPAAEKKPAGTAKKKYKAPFQLYMGSRLRDVTGLFEDGKEYTGDEITAVMIANDEYFFTGKIEYDYIEKTNTVVAMSIQHKKG